MCVCVYVCVDTCVCLLFCYRLLTRYVSVFLRVVRAPRTSVSVVQKWVSVAMTLLKLHDYQTLMAVVAGLNHGAVQRLKVLWSTVKQKSMEDFITLESLFK